MKTEVALLDIKPGNKRLIVTIETAIFELNEADELGQLCSIFDLKFPRLYEVNKIRGLRIIQP